MESQSRGFGCTVSHVVSLVIVVALVAGAISLVTSLTSPSDAKDAQSRLATERAEALQPWNIAVAITLRALLIVALVSLVIVLFRFLDIRARTIWPDRDTGQMPAYRVRRGETVVDLNRSADGKAQTAILGGRTLLLAALFFRYALRREPPPELEQPAVTVLPPDATPEQMQVTSQAQAVQALAAASRRGDPERAARTAQMLAPPARQPQNLPPMLIDEAIAPRETQLLLEQARNEWDEISEGDEHG
jgi:hypothetical protein